MFAIAFDLVVADTLENHPKGVTQAYADIRNVLTEFGFEWRQGSLYTTDKDDLANLFAAIMGSKSCRGLLPRCGTFEPSRSSIGLTSRLL
jgi:virulence-associated protein VapD